MAGTRRIHPDIEAAVTREYGVGNSASKLAAKYGIGRKSVVTIVRRNGGTVLDQRSASGRPMMDTSAFHEKIISLREQGASVKAICESVGLCPDVVRRTLRKLGEYRPTPALRGKNHGSWKGGVIKSGGGKYLAERALDFPFPAMVTAGGYVLQHRAVMALMLNRPLEPHETVHHINGDATDNRVSNLQLRSGRHGNGVRLRCRCCGSVDIEAIEI